MSRLENSSLQLGVLANLLLASLLLAGCVGDDPGSAQVQLQNDFDNPAAPFQPPWTICESSYVGVDFGKVGLGETSVAHTVTPGLDYVLMVAAWDDPTCAPENCLPLVSAAEEEVVDGQVRTIALSLANHQGACPPTGVAPMPEAEYDRILALWPSYGFKTYAERTLNTQCLP